MNCPFYGRAMYQTGLIGGPRPILLLDTRGNQCAIVTTSHTPCSMEVNGEEPDWKACPLVRELRMEPPE
jgi:hypothetical protein